MKFKRKLIQTIPELICQFVAKKFEKNFFVTLTKR